MSVTSETSGGGDGFLKASDEPERVRTVIQSSIDSGRQDGDLIHFGIPVDSELSCWGTGEWYFPEDGRAPGRANELFGAMLTTVMDREITISGTFPAEVAEGQAPYSLLLASTVEL
jgi:hypothetical protein